jgi:hypothetical protein
MIARVVSYVPFAAVLGVIAALVPPRGNDYFQFWHAAKLVTTGASAYDQERWAAVGSYGHIAIVMSRHCVTPDAATCLWLYPPWTAWLYAPFAPLDPSVGVVAIAIVTVASLSFGVVLAARSFGSVPGVAGALTVALLTASAPVVVAAIGGHFGGLLLIGLVMLHEGLRRSRTVPFVAGALLLALKPHVVFLLPLIVAAELIRSRTWHLLAAGSATLFMALASFALEPRALPALVAGAAAKVTEVPDNLSLVARSTGALGIAVAVVAVTSAVVALGRAPGAERAAAIVAVGAALSLVLTPYAHSYDHVLLVPAVLLASSALAPGAALMLTATFALATWASYALELARSPLALPVVVPVMVLVALAAGPALRSALERAATRR